MSAAAGAPPAGGLGATIAPVPASGRAVPLFLPCGGGVEPLLADECRGLLGRDARVAAGRGGVWAWADASGAMRANLWSRLAQRVLWPLAHGPVRDYPDVYALARAVDWGPWFAPGATLRVETSALRSPLPSLHHAALTAKDAVVDALREADALGRRPSVDVQRPDVPLALHLGAADATLYVDLSGEALFKRGWRAGSRDGSPAKGEAPLKETLAAALLAAAGWRGEAGDGALVDPACGAGTIAIEAAQLACRVAPGLARRFAFERLAPFARGALGQAWQALRDDARRARRAPAEPVFASDVSFRMTDIARRNAERAGVAEAIDMRTVDLLQLAPPAPRGTIVMNPPYGERLQAKGRGSAGRERVRASGAADAAGVDGADGDAGADAADDDATRAFFARVAAHWKRHWPGWTAWVLSPDPRLPQAMRLAESRRVPMWNGPIECRLMRFELVEGSAREPRRG